IDHYGLSVSSFADSIGVQRSSISHLINGRNKPSLDFVMRVVQNYPDINLYWLLYGKGSFPSSGHMNDPLAPTPKDGQNNSSEDMLKRAASLKSENKNPIRIAVFFSDGTFESFEVKKD
ncbi:MAG: helix-turn-helix transcriptional regulator, partial [Flavobacteriaceae bacterium]